MHEFYWRNRRHFWSLIALFQLGYTAFGIYFVGGMLSRLPYSFGVRFFVQMAALFVIPLVLAAVKSRFVHYAGLVLLFMVTAWHYSPYSIS